tara:strand:+ start:49 stop:1425 length:1377 start_codon:yes stop_codon:yes gene_type:complete
MKESKRNVEIKKSLNPNYNLSDIDKLLKDNNKDNLIHLAKELHNADLADLIQNLEESKRNEFVNIIRDIFDPEILTYLNESLKDEIIDILDIKKLASKVSELDVDDAVDVVEDLEESDKEEFLRNVSEKERQLIQEGLDYPEDSAGRLMQRNYVAINEQWNVGNAIDYLRKETDNLPEDFYDIYLINLENIVTGIVPLGRLMSSNRNVNLVEIKNKQNRIIGVLTDQEEVAFQFNKYAMVSAPVVNEDNKIIGSITVDDVVDVIEEEREEDILKLGGVGHADIYDAVFSTTKLRFSWLLVNLLTAIAASVVIGFFQASIEKVVALAVLMPIVASMGGNAGTQTLTVSVRALATKDLTPSNALRIIAKETFVGGINGFVFAILVGLISFYWFRDPLLGLVIAFAMILNLLVAGLTGALIPITLNKLKIDPALASGVILTTITDVFGFLSFLGLASIFII